MAEKLSLSTWTSFAKKRELDDGALVKALTKFDKSDEDKHDARLDAVDEVIAQITKMIPALAKRKKEMGDKAFDEAKGKLYDLMDEAEKIKKATRAAKEAAENEDEEEDTPTLLTSKMVPLLRQLRKPDVTMHAMICTAGRATAVLIMRKPIGVSRRKILAEAVDAKGGAKYIVAQVLFEAGAVTFVVQTGAGGLAKRIRAALLEQTQLRVKVRVRGEDGEQDEDGEDGEEGEQAKVEGQGGEQPGSSIPDAPKPPSPEALSWTQRAPRLRAAVEAALKARHPESSKLQAVMGFASEKAEGKQDYAGGLKALDMVEQLLRSGGTSAPTQPTAGPGPSDGGGKGTVAPAIVYTQSRLAWVATRGKIKAELAKLEKAILDTYKDQPVLPDVSKAVRKLDGVLEIFDESLVAALDEALATADAQEKQRLHGEARAIIGRYQNFLSTDALVRQLDANPFVPIAVQETLSKTLGTLAAKIA